MMTDAQRTRRRNANRLQTWLADVRWQRHGSGSRLLRAAAARGAGVAAGLVVVRRYPPA